MDLLSNIWHAGWSNTFFLPLWKHHLYMQSFYCDPHLLLELGRRQVLAFGTIRANQKGFPRDIVPTSAMEGGWIVEITYVGAMKMWLPWLGMTGALCISTIHPPESIGEPTTVQRRSAGVARQPIPCPPAQCAYQEFMDGVALADQIQQRFSVIRKTNKT